MSTPTLGERIVMALSEAGYPPDWRGVECDRLKAVWYVKPPLEVYERARHLAGTPHALNPGAWHLCGGLSVGLEEPMSDAEHAAHCERWGIVNLRAAS